MHLLGTELIDPVSKMPPIMHDQLVKVKMNN